MIVTVKSRNVNAAMEFFLDEPLNSHPAPVDVACAGESMAMFVTEHSGELAAGAVYRLSVAGAESNVAMYLSKLGLRAAWIGRVGADPFGSFIIKELEASGVDVTRTIIDPARPTGVTFKDRSNESTRVRYYRTGSAASALDAATASAVNVLQPRIIHLSGITSALSPGCEDFVRAVLAGKAPDARVSFDVNWRPALWENNGHAAIKTFAQAADIVFVGLDEAEDLWGLSDVDDVRAFLDRPKVLVVKRGAKGATVFCDKQRVAVPALRVNVVEPVGAGDAFAAGFLAGHLTGLSLQQTTRLGTIVASSALSVAADVGDLPPQEYISGLLNLSEELWEGQSFTPSYSTRNLPHVPNC